MIRPLVFLGIVSARRTLEAIHMKALLMMRSTYMTTVVANPVEAVKARREGAPKIREMNMHFLAPHLSTRSPMVMLRSVLESPAARSTVPHWYAESPITSMAKRT